ncbi:MAG TPA: polysaccharide pyruvyl transferase family protein [Acidimicrobiales bacterium]|nr:polysaccharide pyruvyl transferase family protein [Acidimicrobiales bacterium]
MRPRVAVLGTFDVDNYGDHLFPRIAVAELTRRLPGATVDCYGPFGPLHPTRFTGGPPIRPLGPWEDGRLDRFADTYHGMVVGGGELLHLDDLLLAGFYGVEPAEVELVQPSRWFLEGVGAAREERCPVLWHAIGVPYDLSCTQAARVRSALAHRAPPVVRDAFSRDRLLAAGVLPPVVVAPDSGLLVDRLWDGDELEDRLRRLRARGRHPEESALVVQGCDLLVPWADAIAGAARRLARAHAMHLVLLETGCCRGDAVFADAVARRLGQEPHHRIPADADLADVAAVLATAGLFVGSSLHGAITALVHGRPFVVMNLGIESKLRGFARSAGLHHRVVEDIDAIGPVATAALREPPLVELVADLQAQVDRHFDALASAIVEAMEMRPPTERAPAPGDLERTALLAHVDTLRSELAEARAVAADAGSEVERLRATRTFRYAAPLRAARRSWLALAERRRT